MSYVLLQASFRTMSNITMQQKSISLASWLGAAIHSRDSLEGGSNVMASLPRNAVGCFQTLHAEE